jgi:hypothetical protein
MYFKYFALFSIALLSNNMAHAMENDSKLEEQEISSRSEKDKQLAIVGAARSCDIKFIKYMLGYLKGNFTKEYGEATLLATIDNCTTHPDGPEIVKTLIKKGIDLNYSSGLTPLHRATALAAITGNLRVLGAMLANGADPDRKGIDLYNANSEALYSSCQTMKIYAKVTNDPQIQQIANLLNYYSKLCRNFQP